MKLTKELPAYGKIGEPRNMTHDPDLATLIRSARGPPLRR
jgi:hypothetical protein